MINYSLITGNPLRRDGIWQLTLVSWEKQGKTEKWLETLLKYTTHLIINYQMIRRTFPHSRPVWSRRFVRTTARSIFKATGVPVQVRLTQRDATVCYRPRSKVIGPKVTASPPHVLSDPPTSSRIPLSHPVVSWITRFHFYRTCRTPLRLCCETTLGRGIA